MRLFSSRGGGGERGGGEIFNQEYHMRLEPKRPTGMCLKLGKEADELPGRNFVGSTTSKTEGFISTIKEGSSRQGKVQRKSFVFCRVTLRSFR